VSEKERNKREEGWSIKRGVRREDEMKPKVRGSEREQQKSTTQNINKRRQRKVKTERIHDMKEINTIKCVREYA